jgi:acetylornithine/N-succinyldiaminopimelate aminotransferase
VRIDEARALEQKHMLNLYPPIRMPMVIARGEGARLWDTDGKEYLDFISGGRAVTGVGHCHPKVVAAIREQAGTLLHVSNDFYTEPQLRLAARLSQLTGGGRCFLCNSGAEANEAAIKLARKHGHNTGGPDKYEIVCAENSFHGRTLATITATGQPKYQHGFEPLPEGFLHVPFNDAAALRRAVTERTCAVLLEPVLGESGVYPATEEFLNAARERCDAVGAALILDEVQTGVGRTGRMFAYEHYGLAPDVITLAKGLAGGIPIGAMIAREPVAGAFVPGDHASTFGGSALPAAAALAVLDVIKEEGLLARAGTLGRRLVAGLEALQEKHALITEIRGRGLMVAVDLAEPAAGRIKGECAARGLLVITVGDSMLRLLPPLVLTDDQADRGLHLLGEAIGAL